MIYHTTSSVQYLIFIQYISILCRLLGAWPRDGLRPEGGVDYGGDFELWVDYGQEICASYSGWTSQLPIYHTPIHLEDILA